MVWRYSFSDESMAGLDKVIWIDRADIVILGVSFPVHGGYVVRYLFGRLLYLLGTCMFSDLIFHNRESALWARDRFCFSPPIFPSVSFPQHNRSFGYISVTTVCGLLARGFASCFCVGMSTGAALDPSHRAVRMQIEKSRLSTILIRVLNNTPRFFTEVSTWGYRSSNVIST
jgi:hypothetical protein